MSDPADEGPASSAEVVIQSQPYAGGLGSMQKTSPASAAAYPSARKNSRASRVHLAGSARAERFRASRTPPTPAPRLAAEPDDPLEVLERGSASSAGVPKTVRPLVPNRERQQGHDRDPAPPPRTAGPRRPTARPTSRAERASTSSARSPRRRTRAPAPGARPPRRQLGRSTRCSRSPGSRRPPARQRRMALRHCEPPMEIAARPAEQPRVARAHVVDDRSSGGRLWN